MDAPATPQTRQASLKCDERWDSAHRDNNAPSKSNQNSWNCLTQPCVTLCTHLHRCSRTESTVSVDHSGPYPTRTLTSLVQILELLTAYDAELTDLTLAQGITDPPPALMNMINVVAIAPAALVPEPPNQDPDRPPPPRTSTYLLLPRAGAIMTDPPPITACLSQAGPFRTAARLEIRTDGYFMEDVRKLARSARGVAAPFAHPRLVSFSDFTTTRAMTDAANAQT